MKARLFELLVIVVVIGTIVGCGGNDVKPAAASISDSSVVENNDFVDLLPSNSKQEIRDELMVRKVFGSSFDSIHRAGSADTAAPHVENPMIKSLSNDVLLSIYKRKLLKEMGRKLEDSTIFGVDTRQDINNVASPIVQKRSRSVAALIPKALLAKQPDGSYKLSTAGSYQKCYSLCADEGERFLDQEVCATCTGFAISKDLIVSAGHCVVHGSDNIEFYFVFDFRLENFDGFLTKGIPGNLVYAIAAVLANPQSPADYSVLRVSKPIPADRIAPISTANQFTNVTKFYVLGFPCGLPLKYTDEAGLRSNFDPNYFGITASTYHGNSGSPVFNSTTNLVEGILVNGNDDFYLVRGKGCKTSIVCDLNQCYPEEVTRIGAVAGYLK